MATRTPPIVPVEATPKPKSNTNKILWGIIVVSVLALAYYLVYVDNQYISGLGLIDVSEVAGLKVNRNYKIQTDVGTFVWRDGDVLNAGGDNPNEPNAVWKIVPGNVKDTVQLVSTDGRYLGYCVSCVQGVVKSNQTTMTSIPTDWKLQKLGDGINTRYTFMSSDGHYLSRCYGCGVVKQLLTAHETSVNSWSTFAITSI